MIIKPRQILFFTFPISYNLDIIHMFTRYAHLDDFMPIGYLKMSE